MPRPPSAGRTASALNIIGGQRKARGELVGERQREAGTLAALKTERASVAAKGRQMETEAAPIRYVAELVGADTDSERAIRWLIALMVMYCDPLAMPRPRRDGTRPSWLHLFRLD